MGELFRNVLNASFQGGVVIAVVLLVRLALNQAPKKYVCLLWVLVGVRLLCPVTLESSLSLQPQDQVVTQAEWEDLQAIGRITLNRGEEAPLVPEKPVHISEYLQPVDAEDLQPRQICWAKMIPYIWMAGAGILAVYSIGSYGLLRRRVREAVKLTEGVWECDRIDTAFILGYLRPQIYIPAGMPAESRQFILDHEDAHLRRGDHWVKLIGFAALAVHWFNPLVWVAYILMCKDIEMACDESVVKDMDLQGRKAYSEALLLCSTGHRSIAACPVAFGEVSVKRRILSVLNYRKKSFWFTLIAVAAVIFVAVCFLTSPAEKIDPLTLEDWGITMKAMDPTSNGVTVAIDIPENLDGNIVINYGAWVLQVYSDGEWQDVPMLSQEDDYPWNGHVATVFPDNNTHYAKLDWSAVYGEIGPGRYRVCETLELMQDGLGWNKDFYGEFQITGTEASDALEWGITLDAENATPGGMTLFITQSGNLMHQELFYGQDYFLERWNGNAWETVAPIIDNGAFTTEAILLPQNQTTRLDINWKWLYGELSAGTYRIGKSIGNDVTAPIGVNLSRDNLPQEQDYTYFAELTIS